MFVQYQRLIENRFAMPLCTIAGFSGQMYGNMLEQKKSEAESPAHLMFFNRQ